MTTTAGFFLVFLDTCFNPCVSVVPSWATARTLNTYIVSGFRLRTVNLFSFSELTAVSHCSLPSRLRYSTTYMTFEESGSFKELHSNSTELCVTVVAIRSKGGSVGFGVGVVVGGGVVVVITSEN